MLIFLTGVVDFVRSNGLRRRGREERARIDRQSRALKLDVNHNIVEDRCLLSTFYVTSSDDGAFREVVDEAMATPNNTISFQSNVELTAGEIPFISACTIDGNGDTITVTTADVAGGTPALAFGDYPVTIQNLNVVGPSGSSATLLVAAAGNLNWNGGGVANGILEDDPGQSSVYPDNTTDTISNLIVTNGGFGFDVTGQNDAVNLDNTTYMTPSSAGQLLNAVGTASSSLNINDLVANGDNFTATTDPGAAISGWGTVNVDNSAITGSEFGGQIMTLSVPNGGIAHLTDNDIEYNTCPDTIAGLGDVALSAQGSGIVTLNNNNMGGNTPQPDVTMDGVPINGSADGTFGSTPPSSPTPTPTPTPTPSPTPTPTPSPTPTQTPTSSAPINGTNGASGNVIINNTVVYVNGYYVTGLLNQVTIKMVVHKEVVRSGPVVETIKVRIPKIITRGAVHVADPIGRYVVEGQIYLGGQYLTPGTTVLFYAVPKRLQQDTVKINNKTHGSLVFWPDTAPQPSV